VELIWTRATGLVRRAWRATVVLAALAALAAGVGMAVVSAGLRTATAYDRFAAFADVPDLLVNLCPPDADPESPDGIEACYSYDAAAERQVIEALPEVEHAARGSFRGLTVAPADDPSDTTVATGVVLYDPGLPPSTAGRSQIVTGRAASAADEVVLNEVMADRSGLEVGDEVVVTFWAPEETGSLEGDASTFHGPTVEAEVVGITRSLTDLAASHVGSGANDASAVGIPLEMARATTEAGGLTGVLVEATDDDAEAARVAIEAALPGRLINIGPALGADEVEPTRDAIRYEAHATTILGLVLAALAVTFVAQAVARQSRREWEDGPILRAVGMSTRDAAASALLRGLAIGLPAAVAAVVIAVALSPVGPIGIGRRAEVDPGVHADAPVLLVGALLVVAVGAGAAAIPLLGGRALRTVPPAPPRESPRRSFGLPPVASAGLHLARSRQRGAVVLGTALASAGAAVVVVLAAATLTSSFDDLAATPARFGAPWDVSVGADLQAGSSEVETALHRSSLSDSVDQAALITGTDMQIGDERAWVHAYVPLPSVTDEVLPVPLIDGRPPATNREIAVGALTMADAGLGIGDTVEVTSPTTGEVFEVTVVGTAIINDNFEASPGRGAVVTPELMAEAAPGITGDPVILSLTPDTDVDAFARTLAQEVGSAVEPPIQQAAVRNVARIRELPYAMAAVVVLLALASMLHAMVLSVRRHRRDLGVLKSLGFTRRQVSGAVAWHATAYAVVAFVIAVPLGVIAGRWGWQLVAESLGVPVVVVVPLFVPLLVMVGLLALVNLAAAYPAWRAAHMPTAIALRSE
jgi:putative ABC transport system permease protein